jgi:hypothetical protein
LKNGPTATIGSAFGFHGHYIVWSARESFG